MPAFNAAMSTASGIAVSHWLVHGASPITRAGVDCRVVVVVLGAAVVLVVGAVVVAPGWLVVVTSAAVVGSAADATRDACFVTVVDDVDTVEVVVVGDAPAGGFGADSVVAVSDLDAVAPVVDSLRAVPLEQPASTSAAITTPAVRLIPTRVPAVLLFRLLLNSVQIHALLVMVATTALR